MEHALVTEARSLSDADLLARLADLRGTERGATARVVAHLAEVERRDLHLARGYPSMFAYCHRVLGYSEEQCYARIEAARCVRDYPVALDLLLAGSLTMSAIGMLRRHLTAANHAEVLAAAAGRSKPQVAELVAALQPKPDVPATLRRVPMPTVAAPPAPLLTATLPRPALPPPRPAPPAPLSPDRYRYQLTIDAETKELLARAKSLSTACDADLLKRALALLVSDLEKKKYATTPRPAARPQPTARDSRHVPAASRRHADEADRRQCGFVGDDGLRCTETRNLEFHHTDPYAAGGGHGVGRIELRCRQHNRYEARLFFARDKDGAPRLERPPRLANPDGQLGPDPVQRNASVARHPTSAPG